MAHEFRIKSIDEGDFKGKTVLLRVDINSPVDKDTKKIINDNRIEKSVPTIKDLTKMGARLVIVAHQGDTTDYGSLISLREHAGKLSSALGKKVGFIEDIAGPAALEKIKKLKDGEILLLDNLRYFTEEVSTFEENVTLAPSEMKDVFYVRRLLPLFDCYVNDAFSAAHRNTPSMVAFQGVLPSYGGRLLINELEALSTITENPEVPCIYLLGGSRAGDSFGMMNKVLSDNTADNILTGGLIGHIFMMADGISLGEISENYIKNKGYEKFIKEAGNYLNTYREKIVYPMDIAYESSGKREEKGIKQLPVNALISDIGGGTIKLYTSIISNAKTVFVNGPVGIYEEELSSKGTEKLWKEIEKAHSFTVIGGGDTVTSFTKFTDVSKVDYVSTAGGALIRYLSGVELPLIKVMTENF